jgi:hypothetical protein
VNVESVLNNKAGEVYLRPRDIVYVPKTWIAKTDQMVDQYVNQIVPRSLGVGFGYSLNGIGQAAPTAVSTGSAPTAVSTGTATAVTTGGTTTGGTTTGTLTTR